jgi:hypothetical protein
MGRRSQAIKSENFDLALLDFTSHISTKNYSSLSEIDAPPVGFRIVNFSDIRSMSALRVSVTFLLRIIRSATLTVLLDTTTCSAYKC